MIKIMRFNTALLHSAAPGDKATGATLTPIYQSSAFYQESALQHEKLFANKAPGFSYTRIGNPTDRKSTRLNSSHPNPSRMPSSA